MLQFLVGTTTLNIGGLLKELVGFGAYSIPPLFFVGGVILIFTGFYSGRRRPEVYRFLTMIGLFGLVGIIVLGSSLLQLRQLMAYTVAATVWLFLYHEGCQRDVFTYKRTLGILAVYIGYLLIVLSEKIVLNTDMLAYAVSTVFSTHPEGIINYLDVGRVSYFSNEPSMAALAISATILPYIVANAMVNRGMQAYSLLFLALVVLYFAEGLTSVAQILFVLGFVVLPRLALVALPVLAAIALALVASLTYVLTDRDLLISLLWGTFGGFYDRVDVGLLSGSYISRLGGYFVAGQAFLDSPVFGQGIGGTAEHLLTLAAQGFDVFFTVEQEMAVEGEANPHSAQMAVRIPAELGLIGSLYIVVRARDVARRLLSRPASDPMTHYAFMYVSGAMLVSFFFEGSLLNPLICAFAVLLGQMRRRWGQAGSSIETVGSAPVRRSTSSVPSSS